ncbi:MAG: efflux RND transporter periplasmic adaptor subunit [Proteobacteria bacterium]|nr:efflux RND transporter periplasmic adaptor subunit [Pseudomonadota bacterium]
MIAWLSGRTMKWFVKAALPVAVLAAAVLGAGYLQATKEPIEPKPVAEKVWTVAAAPVVRADVQPVMRLYGEIIAGREVELRPLVEGRVVEVGADFVDGGVVHAGDLLVAIDPFAYRADMSEYEARIAEARARRDEIYAELGAATDMIAHDRRQLELARREVARRERLRQSQAGSEKALDDAYLALSQREQQLIERQQTIDRLAAQAAQQKAVIERWQVALRRARRDLADTRLTAPFDGYLVDTDAAVGKRVGTGDRIARLIDADRLEARFHVSGGEFARVLAAGGYRGRAVEVSWRVGGQAFTFAATLDRIRSEIDAESGGVDLYARIEGQGADGVLRPGAFVEVRLADRTYEDVVRLPQSALHDGDTVYAVVDERLEPRQVEVVVRSGNDILVRGDLAPGDMVVTSRLPEIGPGIRVAVR